MMLYFTHSQEFSYVSSNITPIEKGNEEIIEEGRDTIGGRNGRGEGWSEARARDGLTKGRRQATAMICLISLPRFACNHLAHLFAPLCFAPHPPLAVTSTS